MDLIADFCYGIPIEDRLEKSNIAHVLCSASYLEMSGPENLQEVCRSQLEKLTATNVTACLQILDNCTDVCLAAEAEGVSRRCIEVAAHHFKSSYENACIDDFCDSLKGLPTSWFVQLIETMQAKEYRISLITSLSACYIDGIVETYNRGGKSSFLQQFFN